MGMGAATVGTMSTGTAFAMPSSRTGGRCRRACGRRSGPLVATSRARTSTAATLARTIPPSTRASSVTGELGPGSRSTGIRTRCSGCRPLSGPLRPTTGAWWSSPSRPVHQSTSRSRSLSSRAPTHPAGGGARTPSCGSRPTGRPRHHQQLEPLPGHRPVRSAPVPLGA